jgi:hypothetical protein
VKVFELLFQVLKVRISVQIRKHEGDLLFGVVSVILGIGWFRLGLLNNLSDSLLS